MPINPSLLGQPRLPTCAGKHQHFIDHKYFVDIKINKWLYKTYNGERWDLDYQNKCRGSVQRSKQHLGQRESWVSVGNVDKPEGFFFFFSGKVKLGRLLHCEKVCACCVGWGAHKKNVLKLWEPAEDQGFTKTKESKLQFLLWGIPPTQNNSITQG